MSQISDFAGRVKAKYDSIGKSVDDIAGDVQGLKDKITQLQNSAGTVTPEDQALLDDIETTVGALADKTAALDDATAPDAVPAPTT